MTGLAYVITCCEPHECPETLAVRLDPEDALAAVEAERRRKRVKWRGAWVWSKPQPWEQDAQSVTRRASSPPNWPGHSRALVFEVRAFPLRGAA